MLKHLHTVVPCDVTGGILLESQTCELFINANRPLNNNAQSEIQQQLLESMAQINGLEFFNLPVCLHNLNDRVQALPESEIQQINSHFFTPIIADCEPEKQIIGMLFVGQEKNQQFTEQQLQILEQIANQTSTYIQQLQILLEVKKNRLENNQIRQALAKQKELNELKNRIVRTISHEYRTPLTIISLATDLLDSQANQLNKKQKETCFHKIRMATEHLTNLVEDALVVNQVESDEITFTPQHIDLVLLCQELVEEFSLAAGHKYEILANYQACEAEQSIYLDKKIVKQILHNLLSNAIKYSPNGGLINLNVSCSDRQVTFQIRDRGIGIPLEDRSSLFECFHRAANVGTLPGTGLGLAIVKKFVEIHQGEIYFESRLNTGTTFTIVLPIVRPNY